MIEIRDQFGVGSILRLADDPATAKFAEPIADKLMVAARRYATQPDRLTRFVAALTGTPGEQDYAVARLKEAGPLAVPVLVEALEPSGDHARRSLPAGPQPGSPRPHGGPAPAGGS